MAVTETKSQEILLNGYKYKINGKVKIQSLSLFPDRMSVGDDSYDNMAQFSSWNINDLRGGIGVEEMDEKVDWNKCWWTNCIISNRGHILPPRLATAVTAPVAPSPTAIVNADMELTTGWTGGARDGTYYHANAGKIYSWLRAGNNSGNLDIYQDLTGYVPGATYTFTCWAYPLSVDNWVGHVHIILDDGVDTTESDPIACAWTPSWAQMSVAKTISIKATRLRLIMRITWTAGGASGGGWGYWDDAAITLTQPTLGTISHMANFNSKLYVAHGTVLSELNAGGTALTVIGVLPATITAVVPYGVPGGSNRLFIYLGDSTNYVWMDTADPELFTQSNSALANWGWEWDNKLFKAATTGAVTYSTDPDGGAPTWTAAGTITDIPDQIESFLVGRDATGNPIVYCATNSFLKVLVLGTPEWENTEVSLPNHPKGGQGACYFNGKVYLSYGLGVKEYYAETGSLREIGLAERDGLPIEFNGEIVKLYGDSGIKGMFALVDASDASITGYPGLYLWDGIGWQCWWYLPSLNAAMRDVIVSSASSRYAVYWGCASTIYYIDIPRGIQNPNKLSQSYATGGILVSPWFDAGNAVASKLAKSLHTFAMGITTTETVAISYRINHTSSAIATGWTLLETLNTTGENEDNEELFASGAGLSIKAIQFKLVFVTPGATAKPDIQSLVFYYKKRTGSENIWSWTIPIVVDNEGQTTAKQKWENLKAAKESDTDVLFSYHPNDNALEQFYVSVDSFDGTTETGRRYEGNYLLRLIQV